MKKIQCEACGSNDLVFQDNFLVCRSCGTKYLITGIETLQKAKNYRILARRAFEEKDYENAKKYYEGLLTDNPDDWEAYCFSKLSNVNLSNENNMLDNLVAFNNSVKTIVELIYKSSDDPAELRKTVEDVNKHIMATSKYLYDKSDDYEYDYDFSLLDYDEIDDEKADKWEKSLDKVNDIKFQTCMMVAQWNNNIRDQREDIRLGLDKSFFIENYKQLVEQLTFIGSYEKVNLKKTINDLVDYIHTEEPEWKLY